MVKDIRIEALLQQKQADSQGCSPPDSMIKGCGSIWEWSFELANSIDVNIQFGQQPRSHTVIVAPSGPPE
jgi:hypothetical protein